MTTVGHVVSASLIAYTATHLGSHTIDYPSLVAAIAVPAALDLDHPLYILKNVRYYLKNIDKHVFHQARSPMHELAGVVILAVISLAVAFVNVVLAQVIFISFIVHIIEDMVVGKALPFNPIDKSMISLFNFGFKGKTIIDISVILISALLWIAYLKNLAL